ncbi:hypothetical protein EDB84DRAFT_1524563 [Lactarius hengduanensis]|nr:hypothetical protein EDB84DRAFT_1524563 [Lactarius hengduanensis]
MFSRVPSHATSSIIHTHLSFARTPSTFVSGKPPIPATPAPRDAPSSDIAGEMPLLWVRRLRRACGSCARGGCVGRSSSRRARASAAQSRQRSRAATVIKAAVVKVLVNPK